MGPGHPLEHRERTWLLIKREREGVSLYWSCCRDRDYRDPDRLIAPGDPRFVGPPHEYRRRINSDKSASACITTPRPTGDCPASFSRIGRIPAMNRRSWRSCHSWRRGQLPRSRSTLLRPIPPPSAPPPLPGSDRGNCSFAINKLGFAGLPDPGSAFPDGLSNTIAAAEHYSACGPKGRFNFLYSLRSSSVSPDNVYLLNEHAAATTFADITTAMWSPISEDPCSVRPSRIGTTLHALAATG